MQDHELVANIEEFISEGCPFDAPYTNVFCQLFCEVIGLIASDDCIQ